MKTTVPKEQDVQRDWVLVDASDKVLGRLAVRVANMLRGKDRPDYTPHVDTGCFVVITNAAKVRLTGKKEDMKIYHDFSGYRGGLKSTVASVIREKNPERIILDAVRRMLPKNRLMRQAVRRLKVYPGDTHPHEAQNPQMIEV